MMLTNSLKKAVDIILTFVILSFFNGDTTKSALYVSYEDQIIYHGKHMFDLNIN